MFDPKNYICIYNQFENNNITILEKNDIKSISSCESAGCYHPENNFSDAFSDMCEALNISTKVLEENEISNLNDLLEAFPDFEEKTNIWIEENADHCTVEAYQYNDGQNFRTIVIEDFQQDQLEYKEHPQSEEILKTYCTALETGIWENLPTKTECKTESFIFINSRYPPDFGVCVEIVED